MPTGAARGQLIALAPRGAERGGAPGLGAGRGPAPAAGGAAALVARARRRFLRTPSSSEFDGGRINSS